MIFGIHREIITTFLSISERVDGLSTAYMLRRKPLSKVAYLYRFSRIAS